MRDTYPIDDVGESAMPEGTTGEAEEPEQQELLPIDGAERLARVEALREALERAGDGDGDGAPAIVDLDPDLERGDSD
jgi:hypothetical protein